MKASVNRLVARLTLLMVVMALVTLFLAPASCGAPEQKGDVTAETLEIWQLDGFWRYSPQSIWGDTFVAGEYVFGDGLEEQYVTAYNLQTREQQRLVEIPLDYRFEEPSIYEDKVVWSSYYFSQEFRMSQQKDFDTLNWDVFLLDVKTGEIRQITTDEHVQRSPRIYGDTIVWLDNRDEVYEKYPHHYDVYAYSLKTGEERRITTTNSITAYDLAISGSMVVWTDSRNDDPASRIQTRPPIQNDDIYLYDLSTNQERQITTDPGSDSSPVIDNGRIVWTGSRRVREADIFIYDVNTGEETQISKSGYAAHNYYPAICGNRIVWADARISQGNTSDDTMEGVVSGNETIYMSGAAEIYLYDLGTGKETLLVPSAGTEYTMKVHGREMKNVDRQVWLNPVMHGDFIVYTWVRQVDPTVYVMRLDDE